MSSAKETVKNKKKAKKSFFRKLRKIISISILVIIIIIIGLSVIAKVKEKEITDAALEKISQSINAPIKIGDISFNLIRRIPFATIELKNIQLGTCSSDSLSSNLFPKNDTVANINRAYISVKSLPLIEGKYEITKVEFKGIHFNYQVNNEGISNLDFLFQSAENDSNRSDTAAVNPYVILNELLVEDVICNYYDSSQAMGALLSIPKIKIDGAIGDEQLRGSANGQLKLSNCSYKSTPLHLMDEAIINFNAAYKNDSIDIKELVIESDGILCNAEGSAVVSDNIAVDLIINGK
ncbi:MAG: AsmA family protein, partial [Bacteroidales bacterium]|nr:AsmA family protein [Bacteroidales bacterium]